LLVNQTFSISSKRINVVQGAINSFKEHLSVEAEAYRSFFSLLG